MRLKKNQLIFQIFIYSLYKTAADTNKIKGPEILSRVRLSSVLSFYNFLLI